MIGLAIGRFVIRAKLAEGGMGAVYVAVHERLPNVQKVVKVLLGEFSRNEVVRQRFEREATAASRLKHSNIISIDDFGLLPDGQLFLMMPFLEGKPLDALIRQVGRFTLHHTVQIAVQVFRALQHLHESGIVHRDLKPGNIFVTRTNDNPFHVTLIDLGIARDAAESSVSAKTQTGLAMGTPGYMAVEQFEDAASVTHKADLYAAAIILWEMLTGQMPWGFHDERVLFFKQKTEIPHPPVDHGLPAEVFDLLRMALSPNPHERPATARAFAVALASMTPALPPHLPSGAQILERFANEFVRNLPATEETIRNSGNVEHAISGHWPHRGTELPAVPQTAPMPSAPATPLFPPTVSERPLPATPTTLGAATGVTSPQPTPSSKRGWLAAAALAGVVLAAVAAFAVVRSANAPSERVAPASSPSGDDSAHSAPVDAASVVTTADAPAPVDAAAIPSVVAEQGSEAGSSSPPVSTKASRKVDRKRASSPKTENSVPASAKRGSAAAFDPDAVEE